MKKVAISANTSWYLFNFRKNTIISLINNGYSVVALAPHDVYSIKLQELGCEFVNVDIDQGGTNPIKDAWTFIQFVKVFKSNSIDCVLNFTPKNNIYSTLAAYFTGVKTINNIAGLGILFINESFTSKIARFLYKVSQNRADKIFFQNEDDRKLFLDNGFAARDITDRLPGSGVDLNRFSVTPSKDDGVVRFLLIARMLYDKGVGHYVEAAREIVSIYGNRVEFRLLGFLDVNNPSAISPNQMKSWVDEGIITYLGTSDSVEKEIEFVDCVVLPSFYREGVPKSLLEAGAMGKPILTSDNVGCRETVDDGINGYLCKPRSTDSLVQKLKVIIEMSHEDRTQMGIMSRRKMEDIFDENIVINKYINAIQDLLES